MRFAASYQMGTRAAQRVNMDETNADADARFNDAVGETGTVCVGTVGSGLRGQLCKNLVLTVDFWFRRPWRRDEDLALRELLSVMHQLRLAYLGITYVRQSLHLLTTATLLHLL